MSLPTGQIAPTLSQVVISVEHALGMLVALSSRVDCSIGSQSTYLEDISSLLREVVQALLEQQQERDLALACKVGEV